MMTLSELGRLFAETCSDANRGEKVTAIHFFGIRYAEELRGFSTKELGEIAVLAGESEKYGTELRKMVRLSKFVEVKRN